MNAIAYVRSLGGEPAALADLERLVGHLPMSVRPGSRATSGASFAAQAHVPTAGVGAPSGLVLAADVRLDARAGIVHDLGLAPGAHDDADLVLRAYLRWGEAAFERLRGDYALVLDDPGAGCAWLVVDRVGGIPLTYAHHAGRLIVSSSARAMVLAGLVPADLDEDRVLEGLVDLLEASEPGRTIYRPVRRLIPGEVLRIAYDGTIRRRVLPLIEDASVSPGGLEVHVQALRQALTLSVAERLEAARPVGAMLSGGLDSSSIVARARRLLSGERLLPTFSVLGDDPAACPETACVLAVEAQGGLEPTHLQPREMGRLADDVLRLLEQSEDPYDAGMGLVPTCMALLARRAGCGVLFTGIDGDLATSLGSDLPGYALARGRVLRAWALAGVHAQEQGLGRVSVFWQQGLKRLPPRPLRRIWQHLARSEPRRTQALLGGLGLRPEVVTRLRLPERLTAATRAYWPDVGVWGRAPQRRYLARLGSNLLQTALARMQRVAWHAGVEVRHPLASLDLLRACARIPYWAKDAGGWTKGLLRRVGADVLPAMVLARPPQAMNLNGALEWSLAAVPDVRARVEDTLRRARLDDVFLSPTLQVVAGGGLALGLEEGPGWPTRFAVATRLLER